mmetsp:Transcript_8726/g.12273  ORF Transcript_8726/g.12273 Transcript_8726/m.12273 type:complete len:112 (-) Transcript_8726:8-343(-)
MIGELLIILLVAFISVVGLVICLFTTVISGSSATFILGTLAGGYFIAKKISKNEKKDSIDESTESTTLLVHAVPVSEGLYEGYVSPSHLRDDLEIQRQSSPQPTRSYEKGH